MRTWHLAHGKDGWQIATYEAPAWRRRLDRIGEWSTHHVFAGVVCCRIPGWSWSVPLGRPVRDADGWLENSLGSWLWSVGQRLHSLGQEWRHSRHVMHFPVSLDAARGIDPEWVAEVEEMFREDETETVTP